MDIATAVFVILATALSTSGAAQGAAADARWAPWLGCWDMVRDSVREGAAVPGDDQPPPPPALLQHAAPRICVTPDGLNGVKLTTTVEGQPTLEEMIVADGSQRPIVDDSCRGSQRAEWSKRGTRLYSQADLTCGNEARSVSGLSFIETDGAWLDIRTVRVGSREATRVTRYRRVGDQPGAPRVAPSRFTLDDVKEGVSKVSPRVVEAALVETKAAFPLSSRQLVDLADAHVPANVIDLVVALSYPEHFVVERTVRRSAALPTNDPFLIGPSDYLAGFGLYDDLGFPMFDYSPLSYSYLGRYDPRYFFDDGGLVVSGGGRPVDRPSGTGRVINGVGYTQVRPRDAGGTSGHSTSSSSSDASSGSSSSGSGSNGSSSSGSASGGGSVSSGGFYSGGGGDTGRTAVPR